MAPTGGEDAAWTFNRICNCTNRYEDCCGRYKRPWYSPPLDTVPPYKCPDCGAWFVYEHTCRPPVTTTSSPWRWTDIDTISVTYDDRK